MATFTLDEREQEMIYLALAGIKNRLTLQKMRTNLEAAKLPHAVLEVEDELRVLEGSGVESPGLLRIFNPQHDLLADRSAKPTAKGGKAAAAAPADPRQGSLLDGEADDDDAGPEAVGGVDDTPAPAPSIGDGITWADDVPRPRPAVGDRVVYPAEVDGKGMPTTPLGEGASFVRSVMAYDPERAAFRVVCTDGVDTFVFSYGLRDAAHWRVMSLLGEYPDGSDRDVAPLGSLSVLAVDLYREAHDLLALDAATLPLRGALLDELVARVVPIIGVIAADKVAPDYLREHVTRELAQADDNAHAIARLMLQYAESAAAQAGGVDLAGELAAAKAEGAEGDGITFPEPSGEWGKMTHIDGVPVEEPAGTIGGAEITGDDTGDALPEIPDGVAPDDVVLAHEATRDAEPVAEAPAAKRPSAQRKRNAAQAGVKKALPAKSATKPAPKPASKSGGKRKGGGK
jgi:hypothetical protein